jgi:hypothetical protein
MREARPEDEGLLSLIIEVTGLITMGVSGDGGSWR